MFMRTVGIVISALGVLLISCGPSSPSVTKEVGDVERQQQQYLRTQPPPYFDFSLERHMMVQLYQARNNAVATYTYVQSPFTGKILWECPSIGYPIPGGTQLTSPNKPYGYSSSGVTTIDQAEPNGLFSPSTSAGTWVMCANPDGSVSPSYVEDNVRTMPFPMVEKDGKLVRVEGSKSSVTVSTKQP